MIGHRTRVIAGQYYDVIENQAVPSQFAGSFPAFSDEAAFQNLSRCLAGRDLNRMVHRDPRATGKLGFLFGLHFALGAPLCFSIEPHPVLLALKFAFALTLRYTATTPDGRFLHLSFFACFAFLHLSLFALLAFLWILCRILWSEINFGVHPHRNRLAALHGRLETPLANCFDGRLIERRIQRFLHLNVLRNALVIDRKPKEYDSFDLLFTSVGRIFGLDVIDELGFPIAISVSLLGL